MKYGAAALVLLVSLAASHFSAYQWGMNVARLEQANSLNEALAKSAQHIIDEQSKQQKIEDVIVQDKDNSKIKSPVLMRTLVGVSKCSGKPYCD